MPVKSVPEYLALIDDETLATMQDHVRNQWRMKQIEQPESIEDLKHNVAAVELEILSQESLRLITDEIKARGMVNWDWKEWPRRFRSAYANLNALGFRSEKQLHEMLAERAAYVEARDDAPAQDRIRREEHRMILDALAAGADERARSVGRSAEELRRIHQELIPLDSES